MFTFQHCWTEYEVFAQLSTHNLPVLQSNQCHVFPWTMTHAVSTVAAERNRNLWISCIKLCYYCIPCVRWKVVELLKWQPAFQSLVWTPQFILNIIWKWTVVGYLTWKKNESEREPKCGLLENCVDRQDKKNIPFRSNTNVLNQAGPMLQAMVFKGEVE